MRMPSISTKPWQTVIRSSRGFMVMAIVAIGVFTFLRLLLLLSTGVDQVPLPLWPTLFLKGLWFDVWVAGTLLAPCLFLSALVPGRMREGRFHRAARFSGLWLIWFLLGFSAASEVAFWQEFSTRLNFIAVDYLIYTQEVVANIRQSYPVGWILLAIAIVALAPAFWLARSFRNTEPLPWKQRGVQILLAMLIPSMAFLVSDIDQMTGSGNTYADELSGNGMMTFIAAFRRNELDYDRFYDTIPQQEADEILESLDVERLPLTQALRSRVDLDPEPMGPLKRSPRNVVLISVESLSASFLDTYGSRKHLTPNLDRLAAEGFHFDHVFATGTRTVRGLESLSLGIPPVPGQAVVRRPANDHLSTLGEILRMQGFETFYIYGGYGYFDNMNAYFQGNDYEVVDRADFPRDTVTFENAWGVADENLYANALTTLNRAASSGKRVFAQIMTTSNHTPFTYPDGRIDIPSPGGREGAVKYTDNAIGQFIQSARKEPWFKDTLFVITADHCASVAGRTRLPVARYRIPLIWYGPDLITPGKNEDLVSQLDIPPTLLDTMGAMGDDQFFGLSIFEQKPNHHRAFISNYQSLGYLKNGILTVLQPKHRTESYRVDPRTLESTPTAVDPVLRREAIAYYQTAAHALKLGRLSKPDDLDHPR